ASWTSVITWERYESSPIFSTLIVSEPSLLIDPPITSFPFSFSTGTDSPVSMDSSIEQFPSIIVPSTGIFSPGLTRTRSSFSNQILLHHVHSHPHLIDGLH